MFFGLQFNAVQYNWQILPLFKFAFKVLELLTEVFHIKQLEMDPLFVLLFCSIL